MQAPIFATCAASSAVVALLGAPLRLFMFGMAPQNVIKPYVVWQVIAGLPENFLNGRPDINGYRLQIDAYAANAQSARDVQDAIERAIELQSHVVSYNGESIEPETLLNRSSFDVQWFVSR